MSRPYLQWIVCPLLTRKPPCQAYLCYDLKSVRCFSASETPENFQLMELQLNNRLSRFSERLVAHGHLDVPELSDTPLSFYAKEIER